MEVRAMGSKEDEEAIRRVAAEWQAAWNSHDVRKITGLLSPDVDFVNVLGEHLKGPSQIEKRVAGNHATFLKDLKMSSRDLTVQFIAPDAALVHFRWARTGDAGPQQTRGSNEGVFTWVVLRQQNEWKIRAMHNTIAASG
jgi:uncharacterized protein (TIGR02246 family)